MPTPMSPAYKISERETESVSNIDALYNNICCVPFMKYSGRHTEKGRYMVVCHDLGCSIFYSIYAEPWNRAQSETENIENPLTIQ